MSDTPQHRGRIQAQGSGLEESESWASDNPPTWQEELDMLEKLKNKLSKKDKELRKKPFKKAERFIKNAGNKNGVDAPVSISFKNRHEAKIRVDIEVKKGIAFISVLLFLALIYSI